MMPEYEYQRTIHIIPPCTGIEESPPPIEKPHVTSEKPTPPTQTPQEPRREVLTMELTYYVAMCRSGCTGITATGMDVRNRITTPQGRGIIAVDPDLIPLYTIVEIDGREYQALDTGGAINGHIIDVLVDTEETARRLGRQTAEVTIISKEIIGKF